MDDLMARPLNHKVLASLGAKFGVVGSKRSGGGGGGADPLVRKTSVCSLDEIRRKEEHDQLSRVLSSPSLKSPVRTPVTENDPLGAFSAEEAAAAWSDAAVERGQLVDRRKSPSLEGVRNVSAEIELDGRTGTPILFERRKEKWDVRGGSAHHRSMGSGMDRAQNGVPEAATDEEDEADSRLKELDASAGETTVSRASTLPADDRERAGQSGASSGDHGSPFRTSLGHFKLPFR